MAFREPGTVVKVLYCLFLGALLVLFVGWAMAAWYPTPTWETEYPTVPQYDSEPQAPGSEELKLLSPDQQRARYKEYNTKKAQYEAKHKDDPQREVALRRKIELHNRAVSLTSLVIAVIIVGFSVGLSKPLPVIAEGLLLGGLFTLIYSIGWSFIASPKVAVIPVGVGLIVTIWLGYRRFVRPARSGPSA